MDIRQEFSALADSADKSAEWQQGYAAGVRKCADVFNQWIAAGAGDGIPRDIVKLPVSEPLTATRIREEPRNPLRRAFDEGYEKGYAEGKRAGELAFRPDDDEVVMAGVEEPLEEIIRLIGLGTFPFKDGERLHRAVTLATDFGADGGKTLQERVDERKASKAKLPATRHHDCLDACADMAAGKGGCFNVCGKSSRARAKEAEVNAGAKELKDLTSGDTMPIG